MMMNTGLQVLMSYGPVWEIQQFLGPFESTKMQQLNKYFYNIGVGRAQTRIVYKFLIRTGENGVFFINDKLFMEQNETRESKEQLVDWIKEKVGPGKNCVTSINV